MVNNFVNLCVKAFFFANFILLSTDLTYHPFTKRDWTDSVGEEMAA